EGAGRAGGMGVSPNGDEPRRARIALMNIGTSATGTHCDPPVGQTVWSEVTWPAPIHWRMAGVGCGPDGAPPGPLRYQSLLWRREPIPAPRSLVSRARSPRWTRGMLPAMTLPPGPRRPAIVQTAEWWLRPLLQLDACALRFGDVFTLRFVSLGDIVIVS